MSTKRIDLHVHTGCSYDSFMKVETIVKQAKRKGLDGVAITDHDAFGCARAAMDGGYGISIIPGQEIKTQYGDLLGLFLSRKVASKDFLPAVQEIKAQQGIVVLPHPFKGNRMRLPEDMLEHVDAIEAINSRNSEEQNQRAFKLAEEKGLPVVAGSDAHSYFEIGNAYTVVEGENLEDMKKSILAKGSVARGRCSNFYLSHGISLLNEKLKRLLR